MNEVDGFYPQKIFALCEITISYWAVQAESEGWQGGGSISHQHCSCSEVGRRRQRFEHVQLEQKGFNKWFHIFSSCFLAYAHS